MRYSRVLTVVGLVAAVALATVLLTRTSQAVTRSSQTRPATQLRQAVKEAAEKFLVVQRHVVRPGVPNVLTPQLRKILPPQLWNVTPLQLGRLAPAPPTGGTTCFVATSCSITPCVVPVAAAAPGPGSSNAVTSCPSGAYRVPKALRVAGP